MPVPQAPPTLAARPHRTANWRLALAGAVVFLAAAALYLRTVGHELVWDDLSILMAADSLDDWSRLGANVAPGFFREPSGPQLLDYWRPAVVVSHMAERSLFGHAAWGPHLVNVLLHATTSVLVLLLCRLWSRSLRWSVVAGLVFAVHPVQVEVVAWVSGRSDLLLGLFLALALWADGRHGRTGRVGWQLLSLGSFALAVLSKEAAIVFPALIGARALLAPAAPSPRGRRPGKAIVSVAASLAVLLLLLWVRFGLLDAAAPEGLATPADRSSLFWTWWSAFGLYVELLVWPANLTILHHVELVGGIGAPRVIAGVLAFLSLGWGCWRLRRRAPGAAFGIAVFLVGLAPVSNFLIPVSVQGGAEFPVAERFLYAPSIGFSLCAAWVLAIWLPDRLRRTAAGASEGGPGTRSRRTGGLDRPELVARLLACLVILALGVRAADRIRDWKSDLSLFAAAVADSPGSYLAHLNYAAARVAAAETASGPEARRAMLETARRHYLEAAELAPRNYRVHYDLGNLYRSQGLNALAEGSYRRALELHPGLLQARINLGAILARKGDLEGALSQFEAADRLRPGLAAAKVNRAHVLQMLGRPAEAIPLYEEALALEPGLDAARDGLTRAKDAASATEAE